MGRSSRRRKSGEGAEAKWDDLNPGLERFRRALDAETFADQTGLLSYTNRVDQTRQKYICVSGPRRSEKSMAADMLAAYYSRGGDYGQLFQNLEISADERFSADLCQSDVIRLDMQEFFSRTVCGTERMDELLRELQSLVMRELIGEYPDVDYYDPGDLIESTGDIYEETGIPFVIIIEE